METYAGFWRRAGAFALDYIPIFIYLLTITLLSLLFNALFGMQQLLFADRARAQLTAFLFVTLPVALYFALSESSSRQATWGKRRVGLKVIDFQGGRISFWRSLARTALKLIPWELSHTLVWEIYFSPQVNAAWIDYGFILVYVLIGLNIASLTLSKKHQTIYDFLAGTYVTKQHFRFNNEILLHQS